MSVYEMARHYYQDFAPPLWSEARLDALVKAGKLTEGEKRLIVEGPGEE